MRQLGTLAEADVVVVGGGPAGLCAAVEAVRAGASVTVIESLDRLGGNGPLSGGYLALVGSDMQRVAGVEDSTERFLEDMRREMKPYRRQFATMFDERLARQFVAGSPDAFLFLIDLGFTFDRIIDRPGIHSVPRLVALADPQQFRNVFSATLDELGVVVRHRTFAERLHLVDGRIDGVVVCSEETDRGVVRAGKGVVIAAGGFQAGQELRRRYQPEHLARTPALGIDTCTGQGHLMGQSMGADLINMPYIQSLVIVGSALLEDAIAVNVRGARFHDEMGPVSARLRALGEQPNARGFYVFDNRVMTRKPGLVSGLTESPVAADTLGELAGLVECDPAGLARAVAEWNELLGSSTRNDPFGRTIFTEGSPGIVEPPFRAARMVPGAMLTAGGFQVDERMRVLDVYGDVIAHLFGAGDCVGGILPPHQVGGVHLGSAVVFGRIAGAAAASGGDAG
ncbi:MAG: FAD-dependent oxidoreductase [Propionibacteriales bacterium]|nr:FAD-dependent oxidoreductase [Propionibacteriales bacterium]